VRIRWTQYALAQFHGVLDGLMERRGAVASQQIADRILDRVGALEDLPWSAPAWKPARDESFRRLVVDEYVVLYRVVLAEELVYVLALRHGRQRPLEPDDVPKS
jgi:plasmid stabilization system protein ParE